MMECILIPCIDKGGKLNTLTRKGVDKIIVCSDIRQDGVNDKFLANASLQVHSKCREKYITRPRPPQDKVEDIPAKIPRVSFDFKSLCFLCCRKCKDVSKYRNTTQEKWSLVEKPELISNVRSVGTNRQDSWGEEVLLRISHVIDLTASHGRYHWYCYQRFQKPGTSKPEKGPTAKGGSVSDANREVGFNKLCDFIDENDECQYSMEELNKIFLKLSPEAEPYTTVHLKRKLNQHYGSGIHFATLYGRTDVACLIGTASNILSDTWYQNRNKENESTEELRLIKTAAAIIRREVKSQYYDCSTFPTIDEIASGGADQVPELLKVLIHDIIKSSPKGKTKKNEERTDKTTDRKTTTICHSIISAVRPRSFVSAVQLGTAVSLHRQFGSRLLVDVLCNIGACAPYSEVLKYERSVTTAQNTKVNNGYMQFVFDNADYNAHTIDGHNTFHVMGGVVCVTPKSALQAETNVPRKNVTAHDVENFGLFELQTYRAPGTSGYCTIVASDMESHIMQIKPLSALHDRTLNLFWLGGNWLEGPVCKPGWSGCMQLMYAKQSYETSAVVALPFINFAPSNPSTIYTALLQAAEKGTGNGQNMTMVTFDQPLYAKAREMVAASPPGSPLKSLFIRLGGFHILLSFLSAIGFIMAGSGLEELWSTVYAKNSVTQMLNGKAYSRAVRALYLVEEALITVFLRTNEVSLTVDKDELQNIYSSFKVGNALPDDIADSTAVKNFVENLDRQLQHSKESGRTQKLWIQFIEMVELVRMFVRAERSGDFYLHIYCIYHMLPIFHAAGHLNYAKSAHVYLQDCLNLCSTLCESEFKMFITRGYFTIRRTEKFWSGIWSDMTIEQVLMRALSSNGGMTGGRGITPSTLATWVNSMPTCSRVIEAMETFAGIHSASSEQHIELREANQRRNSKDLQIFISWLEEHNPFLKPPELSSLSNGIVADEKVNCDEAFEVGAVALKSVLGKKFSEIKLKRTLAVKSLATVTKAMKIRDDTVCVNPDTLLHRMVCTVRTDEQLSEIFKYELCAYPPSIFDESGLMRKGSKSSMVKVFEQQVANVENDTTVEENVSYVIDGGHLLHRVVWQRPATFGMICQQYTGYVVSHYGKAHVVFDGYGEEPTTKDEEHLRRSSTSTHVEVKVEDAINVTLGQSEFLTNGKNKMNLIALLSLYLRRAGCTVVHAENDADTKIVSTAIEESDKGNEAIVIGDDTDLLVLLIVHAPANNHLKMVTPKKGNQQEKIYCIREIQSSIGDMKDVLLTVYAFTGCDTVSSIYKKGKIGPFKKVQGNKELRTKLLTFNNPNADPHAVAVAGNDLFISLYSSKHDSEDLDCLRYHCYLQNIAKQSLNSMFRLAVLPPTSAAAQQHSYRVYHQVQQWLNVKQDPLKWGWKNIRGHLRPVTTTNSAAPEELLSLIACTCNEGCIRNCGCKKSGLKCSQMCRNCAGHGCTNTDAVIFDDDNVQDEGLQDSFSNFI